MKYKLSSNIYMLNDNLTKEDNASVDLIDINNKTNSNSYMYTAAASEDNISVDRPQSS